MAMIKLNKQHIIIIVLSLSALVPLRLLSAIGDTDTIYHSFFSKPKFVKNQITFDFNYGLSVFGGAANATNKIVNSYNSDLKYAFTRIYPNENSITKYYASEFIGIENISSHFKPSSIKNIGIPADLWRINIGYRNGNVVELGKLQSIFYHSGSLQWSRLDIPNYLMNSQSIAQSLDEKFKFGTSFDLGISTKIYAPFYLNIQYQSSLIFPNTEVINYALSAVNELIIQRGFDYLDYEYGSIDPVLYPILNWLAKGTFSYLLYNARETKSFYPFGGEDALRINTFKIGINLLLKSTAREINE